MDSYILASSIPAGPEEATAAAPPSPSPSPKHIIDPGAGDSSPLPSLPSLPPSRSRSPSLPPAAATEDDSTAAADTTTTATPETTNGPVPGKLLSNIPAGERGILAPERNMCAIAGYPPTSKADNDAIAKAYDDFHTALTTDPAIWEDVGPSPFELNSIVKAGSSVPGVKSRNGMEGPGGAAATLMMYDTPRKRRRRKNKGNKKDPVGGVTLETPSTGIGNRLKGFFNFGKSGA